MRGVRRRLGLALVAALLTGGVAAAPSYGGGAATSAGCDWPMYGQNPARTFSTSCQDAPNVSDVDRLVPRWYFHANDVITASPAVANGMVYVGAWDGQFYALDLATGKVVWQTALGYRRTDGHLDHHHGSYGTITSSAAVATIAGRQMVFVGAGDSMYALDASRRALPDSQRVIWSDDLDPTHPTSDGEVESSPVIWQGAPGGPVVIFGSDANQDSGYGGEGMWEVRAATGRVVWHSNPEADAGKGLFGCGNVWSSPALALDPHARPASHRAMLYFGTADCPDNGHSACPPDGSDPRCPAGHRYDYAHRWTWLSQAMIAMSAVNGKPVWSYQPFPRNDISDDDFGASAQLFTLPSGEQVVGEANKSGHYYVVDRHTGKLVWNKAETANGNLQSGFALGGLLAATSEMSVNGHPNVYGGAAINTPVYFDERAGQEHLQSAESLADLATPMVGFAGATGARVWAQTQAPTYGPTTSGSGVVYSGATDDFLRAYDAATGMLLWAFPTGAPVSSGAAIVSNGLVVATGTSDTDAEFKTCTNLPPGLQGPCEATPLNATLNPLSKANGIWAFGLS